MAELITESRLRAFRTCPRLHDIQYVQGFRPLVDKEALAFGSMMHAGLEAWWLTWEQDACGLGALDAALDGIAIYGRDHEIEPFALARARVLMRGYDVRWTPAMDDLEVLAVEEQFTAEMKGAKGGVARSLLLGGKIDVIVRKHSDGTTWIIEHKTSGADLSPGSSYWTRLRMDSQISVYFDGAKALGHEVAGCIYDVMDKPNLRQLKATPMESRKFTKEGRLYANQRDTDETIEAYEKRVVDAVVEAPEQYFQRNDVIRLDSEMEEARLDTYFTAVMMRDSMRMGRAPRNPGACHQYGTDCSFLEVCSGIADINDPTRFKRVGPHPELEGSVDNGKNRP